MDKKDIELLDSSIKEYDSFYNHLPYHLNIIEELHVNENAHSRILARLLQYKNADNKSVILESLIDYIVENNCEKKFNKIFIENPFITYEEERIDIRITDEKYAIIIENKVYDAGDQDSQLSRYINKIHDHGYDLRNIFVIYMPSSTREPSEQTWGSYKKDFTERFCVVSFNQDVIFWLKNKVYPNLTLKEVNLKSAIEQYVDYLERYSGQYDKKYQDKLLKSYYNLLSIEETESLDGKYKKLMSFHSLLQNGINKCNSKIQEFEKNKRDS